jgi:hypothetical protein
MIAVAASAQLQFSIGVRETGFAGGPDNGVGGNGGSSGGIEFIDLDAQNFTMDGTWQTFTWTFATATVTAFAGTSANSTLEGNYGVFEHLRIRNSGGVTSPITLWIDDITNDFTPPGGGPTSVNFGDFEGFAVGTEVIFQEPRFSGSTTANLMALPNTSVVTDSEAFGGVHSNQVDFQFVDALDTRWVRLTTFNTPNLPNPIVRFDGGSVLTMKIRAVPEPGTLAVLGLGALALLRRRKK